MNKKTTQRVVSFTSDFTLPGIGARQPAGDYRIEQDEELLESLTRLAWVQTKTFIHIPAIGTQSPVKQMVAVEPSDLEATLQKDQIHS